MMFIKTRKDAIMLAEKEVKRLNNEAHGSYYHMEIKNWACEVYVFNEYGDVLRIYQWLD